MLDQDDTNLPRLVRLAPAVFVGAFLNWMASILLVIGLGVGSEKVRAFVETIDPANSNVTIRQSIWSMPASWLLLLLIVIVIGILQLVVARRASKSCRSKTRVFWLHLLLFGTALESLVLTSLTGGSTGSPMVYLFISSVVAVLVLRPLRRGGWVVITLAIAGVIAVTPSFVNGLNLAPVTFQTLQWLIAIGMVFALVISGVVTRLAAARWKAKLAAGVTAS